MNDSSGSKSNQNLLDLVNLRIRRKVKQPGTIAHDDLGNAQYHWLDDSLLEDTALGDIRRKAALSVNLALIEDEPSQHRTFVPVNKHGTRVGYNPYDSGQLTKQATDKRVDLRDLSKRIEASRKLK